MKCFYGATLTRFFIYSAKEYILFYNQNVVTIVVKTRKLRIKLFVMIIAFLENQEKQKYELYT